MSPKSTRVCAAFAPPRIAISQLRATRVATPPPAPPGSTWLNLVARAGLALTIAAALPLQACAPSAGGSTASEQGVTSTIEGLDQLSPAIVAHTVTVSSGSRLGAAADAVKVEQGRLFVSTGRADQRGFGDTDILADGLPDVVSIAMDIDLPAGTNSVMAMVTFNTSELTEAGAARNNDTAILTVTGNGVATREIVLGSVSEAFRPSSEPRCLCIDVAGLDQVQLTWTVRDAGDGMGDSAMCVSNLGFSDLIQPPGFHAPVSQFDVGEWTNPEKLVADPINMWTGDFDYEHNSLVVPGAGLVFEFSLYYNTSRLSLGGFGGGVEAWRHSFQWEVLRAPSDNEILIRRHDGGSDSFLRLADSRTFVPKFPDVTTTLTEKEDGSLTYTADELVSYIFDFAGRLVRIEDPSGNHLLLFYDADDQVRLIQDTRNNIAVISHDQSGRITSVDYEGMRETLITWEIGNGNRVSSVENPDGLTMVFTYDSSGRALTGTENGRPKFINEYEDDDNDSRVIAQTDAAGLTTEIIYGDSNGFPPFDDNQSRYIRKRDGSEERKRFDVMGRLTMVWDGWDPMTSTFWEYEYDSDGNQSIERDPDGNEWTTLTQNTGNLLEQVDPLGGVTRKTFTPNGDPLTVTDPGGNRTIYAYDDLGRLIAETNPSGDTVHYMHNANGNIHEYSDWNGNTWSYVHDSSGDLLRTTDPMGFTSTRTYDTLGQVVQTANALGAVTAHTYDQAGRLASVTDASGASTSFEYNEFGNLIKQIGPGGIATLNGYSATGHPTTTTTNDGRVFTRIYDGEGYLIEEQDELGRSYFFEYDTDALVSVMDALGNTVTAEYNVRGQRTSMKDPNCGTIQTHRDALGRVVEVIDQEGRSTRMSYDDRGLLETTTNARGQITRNVYDPVGYPSRVETPVRTTYFTSDANGNTAQTRIVEAGDSSTVDRTFDALDRMVARSDENGLTVNYVYDALGNIEQLIYPGGDTVTYGYDTVGRLTTVEDWVGHVTTYVYAMDGALLLIRKPDGSHVDFDYDTGRRMVRYVERDRSGTLITSARMHLGDSNLIDSEIVRLPLVPDFLSRQSTQIYSPSNELQSWNDGTSVLPFEHDADGNLTSGTLNAHAPGTGRALIGPITIAYQYDAIDRLEQVSYPAGVGYTWSFDAAGNILEHSASGLGQAQPAPTPATLTYDEDNRVASVLSDGHTMQYEYGADGQRTARTLDGERVTFVHDVLSGNLLEERDAAGQVMARYVHGLGLISMQPATGAAAVYHYDLRGSTVALTDADNGSVTDRYAYDPYGKLVAQRGTTTNPFKYNGRDGVMDDGNGLNFMRSRYYASGLMRFVHRDRLSAGTMMNTQSLNRYMFVHGNPVSALDSNGDFPWVGALIGATISTAITFISDVADDGEINTHWSTYAGAAVEGAISGLIPGGTLGKGVWKGIAIGAGIGAAGGLVGNVTKQAFAAATDPDAPELTLGQRAGQLGISTGTGAIAGAASGGLSGVAKAIPPGSSVLPSTMGAGRAAIKKTAIAARQAGRQFVKNHKFWFRGSFNRISTATLAYTISKSAGLMRIGIRTGLGTEHTVWEPREGKHLAPE